MNQALEKLLTTLDVRLHAFAVCEIDEGARLVFEPMEVVVVHHVLAGRGVLEIPGAPPAPFAPGYILIVPPGRGQSLAAGAPVRDVPAGENCRMLDDGLIRFDGAEGEAGAVRTICGTLTATYGGSFGLFDNLAGALVEDGAAIPGVAAAFELLLAERSRPDIGTHALTEALMKQCLVLLIRAHLNRGAVTSPFFASLGDTRLAAAVGAVLKQPAAALSLERLADIAGMSRSAFARAFASTFGQTPMEFVQKTRLHHAAQLLTATDLPIKVVAASTGFASRSHFSRTFRAAYGLDPSRYRERHGRDGVDAPRTAGLA